MVCLAFHAYMYYGMLLIANWPLSDVMICNMFIIYVYVIVL